MTVGLVKPNGGKVFLDAQEVTRWPMFKRARAGIGYLPQETSVFRKLTVRDNLLLVLELAGKSKKEQKAKVQELAEELHITDRLDSIAGVLSGGERRRVEIARAMATEPKFILLDEPFTGIDPVTIEEIQAILFKLRGQGIGILITDHNVAATLKITDRNYILIDGKIVAAIARRPCGVRPSRWRCRRCTRTTSGTGSGTAPGSNRPRGPGLARSPS